MRRFLAANPKDKHGTHRYTLADASLDPAVERARYAAYQATVRRPVGKLITTERAQRPPCG